MSTATPDRRGYFGEFGGRYVPETLMGALEELETSFRQTMNDAPFRSEFDRLLRDYVGRPTPLHEARRLAEPGGARILLKREDLAHTGAHKINNALGQVLLAERMGKRRIIAETGAGQHGVATATAAALLGVECIVYMGAEDVRRQQPNVQRMKLLGATVHPVDAGSRTLKDAINEAIRDWVTNIATTHYVIGSAVGPHPYPWIVRELQSVIGRESRAQVLERIGGLPDLVVACVGGGSNAIGMFHPFLEDDVPLLGVEAGGDGLQGDRHAAPLCAGRVGVLHGARSFLMQDGDGQVAETHSVSAGLDYPGVGPEHSQLKSSGRVEYTACSDSDALAGFDALCELEGIVPALESAHAISVGRARAATMPESATVLINLSGRGDKDLALVEEVRR